MPAQPVVTRFGVLGCAGVAWRRTLPAVLEEPSTELVAVASRDRAKADRFAARFGCAAEAGYDALLARPDVDAVYVPVPTGLHHDWALRALAAGKHVLVEKPLATGHAEALAMRRAADAHDLRLMENFMFVHHGQHARVAEVVAGGRIGEPRTFRADFGIPPLPDTDVRYRPDLGGGALLDVGVYPLRAAILHLGPDLRVEGAVLRRCRRRGVDTSGEVLLSTPDGRTAVLGFGFDRAYRCEYGIWGTRGALRLDRAFTPPPDHRPVLELHGPDGRTELALEPDHQFARSLRYFTAAVRAGAVPESWWAATERHAALLDDIRAVARVVDTDRPDTD